MTPPLKKRAAANSVFLDESDEESSFTFTCRPKKNSINSGGDEKTLVMNFDSDTESEIDDTKLKPSSMKKKTTPSMISSPFYSDEDEAVLVQLNTQELSPLEKQKQKKKRSQDQISNVRYEQNATSQKIPSSINVLEAKNNNSHRVYHDVQDSLAKISPGSKLLTTSNSNDQLTMTPETVSTIVERKDNGINKQLTSSTAVTSSTTAAISKAPKRKSSMHEIPSDQIPMTNDKSNIPKKTPPKSVKVTVNGKTKDEPILLDKETKDKKRKNGKSKDKPIILDKVTKDKTRKDKHDIEPTNNANMKLDKDTILQKSNASSTNKIEGVKRKKKKKVAKNQFQSEVTPTATTKATATTTTDTNTNNKMSKETSADSSFKGKEETITKSATTPSKDTSSTTSSSSASKPPKKKKDTYQTQVIKHLIAKLQPFTLKSLASELRTSTVALKHLMLSLTDKNIVKSKLCGKNKNKEIYWIDLHFAMKEAYGNKYESLYDEKTKEKAVLELQEFRSKEMLLNREMGTMQMDISNEELDAQLKKKESIVNKLNERLSGAKNCISGKKRSIDEGPKGNPRIGVRNGLTKSSNKKPKTQLELKKDINDMRNEWKLRKEKCMDFLDNLTDAMEKKPKEVFKLLDIETDEMMNVKLPPKHVIDKK
mmetsp:Transcript_23547/g.28942  ORF Transcript_23547/g.28942 Transcript_23547/m.28942 type:complete len:652 (-) Transcript_23547:330-2285(-)